MGKTPGHYGIYILLVERLKHKTSKLYIRKWHVHEKIAREGRSGGLEEGSSEGAISSRRGLLNSLERWAWEGGGNPGGRQGLEAGQFVAQKKYSCPCSWRRERRSYQSNRVCITWASRLLEGLWPFFPEEWRAGGFRAEERRNPLLYQWSPPYAWEHQSAAHKLACFPME